MSEDVRDMVYPSCGVGFSLNVWRCFCVFLAALLIPGFVFAACGTTYNIIIGGSLVGTPFSGCTISGSTINCTEDVQVSANNVCVTTNASPLIVNMNGKALDWSGSNGEIGTNANPINLVMGTGTININGNSFTSYGNWSATNIRCSTNPQTAINGVLTATSTNTCTQYGFALPVADWRVDESTPYTGAAGEVKNSVSGGTNGTARRSANNLPVTAAFPGNISGKLCGGIQFNGVNYFEVAGLSSQLSGTASLSFWIKTTQNTGTLSSWTSPGVTGVEQGGGGNDVFWGWINSAGKIAVNKGNTLGAQSLSTINTGIWRHIVLTRDLATSATKAYVDGVLESTRNSEPGLVTLAFTSIGRMQNAMNLIGTLDEVKVFATVLSNAQVASIYANESAGNNWDGTARVCPISGPHHVEIQHTNGTGLTCTASTLTVRACADAACTTLYTGGVSGTLTATGTPTVNWDGTTGGATGAGFVIPAGSSSVAKRVQVTTVGSIVIGVTTPTTPAASNATTCNFGSPACTFTASAAGFIFDVPNHVSEVLQTVNVSAVKTADNSLACLPAFASVSKNVTFKCTYANPASGYLPVRVNGAALNASGNAASACDASGQAVSLSFGTTGVASTTFQYADVGNLSLAGTYTGSGADAGLSMTGSDTFIAAPKDFAISAITAGPIKAGNNFNATVTARNNANSATPNFGKEVTPEQVVINRVRYKPSATVPGTSDGLFSGTVGVFSLGSASASNLNWSEVGIIDLNATLASGSYLGSGLTAAGSTGAAGAVGSNGAVVRFVPDHFDTVVSLTAGVPMPCPVGLTCPSQYNGFAYSGQGVPLTVTAKNGLSTPTTTVNYNYSATASESFSKAVTLSAVATVGGAAIATTAPGGVASAAAVPATIFAAGTTPTLVFPVFTFAATSTAPINVFWRASDTDSVTSLRSIPSNSVEGGVKVVSGRLKIANAYGSELLPLPMKVAAQFYNATAWVTSTTDSLSLPGGTVGTSAVTGATLCAVAGFESTPPALALGIGSFTLTKPSNGRCSADITLSTPSFLPSVSGRATFGVYKSPLIYRRENY